MSHHHGHRGGGAVIVAVAGGSAQLRTTSTAQVFADHCLRTYWSTKKQFERVAMQGRRPHRAFFPEDGLAERHPSSLISSGSALVGSCKQRDGEKVTRHYRSRTGNLSAKEADALASYQMVPGDHEHFRGGSLYFSAPSYRGGVRSP